MVRLCTDEDRIVEYWNNIDAQLEVDMDVLDDLSGRWRGWQPLVLLLLLLLLYLKVSTATSTILLQLLLSLNCFCYYYYYYYK